MSKLKARRPRIRLPAWLVIRTKPMQAALAKHHIERQGYQVFWPRVIDERGRLTPLFSDYMFVASMDRSFYFLKSTPGVMTIMMRGSEPVKVPRQVMEQLFDGLNEEGFLEYDSVHGHLSIGAKVRITKGSFQNITGLYIGRTANERVNVLFQFLGQRVTIPLPRSHVELAPDEPGAVASKGQGHAG